MNLHHLLGSVERVESLDAPAAATSRIAGRLIERTRLAGALRGSWLGHPVHPLLITIPVGTWMTSAVFDILFKDVTAARRLIAVGLAATPPTVLAGCPKSRSKRFLTADDVADIARRYEAGETTQQIGDRFGISKTRVATVLHEQGVAIRRQGLNEEQVSDVAMLYAAGRSLGWLAAQYGISPTTVSRALQHHGVTIRPRPGRRLR